MEDPATVCAQKEAAIWGSTAESRRSSREGTRPVRVIASALISAGPALASGQSRVILAGSQDWRDSRGSQAHERSGLIFKEFKNRFQAHHLQHLHHPF